MGPKSLKRFPLLFREKKRRVSPVIKKAESPQNFTKRKGGGNFPGSPSKKKKPDKSRSGAGGSGSEKGGEDRSRRGPVAEKESCTSPGKTSALNLKRLVFKKGKKDDRRMNLGYDRGKSLTILLPGEKRKNQVKYLHSFGVGRGAEHKRGPWEKRSTTNNLLLGKINSMKKGGSFANQKKNILCCFVGEEGSFPERRQPERRGKVKKMSVPKGEPFPKEFFPRKPPPGGKKGKEKERFFPPRGRGLLSGGSSKGFRRSTD